MKRPFALWLLIFFLVFLALGGLYGGIAMLADPSGGLIQMAEVLPLLHVPSYFLPGLFLLFVMGLAPLLLTFGLLARPEWKWAASLARWSGHHWSWTGTVALGIVLLVWLTIQAALIGFRWPIQYVTLTNGILILLFALVPSVQKYYLLK
ncbi:MAG: hypothetical protein C4583_06760 [Anaerolineaceae bacterium]|nr:MAG: hypothetical protein C4583_06760 [Anaerolineaceae bacterium]